MTQNKAILYMIFSAIAFSLMGSVVKYLSTFNVYQVVFYRSVGTLLFTIPLVLKLKKVSFFGTNKKWLIIRGITGVISLTCFFQSLNYLSIGTAVSLRYTAPIFAAIFALFFLKEKIKPIQWFLFLTALLGVVIIKGFGADIELIGLFFVITSAIFLGIIFVVIRKIGNSEHPLVIINYFMIMAFVFGGFMCFKYWEQPTLIEWILFISTGVFGYFGQLYMTKALQAEETNLVAPIKYLEVIFTIIIGTFWFGDIYNSWTLLGILLILSGLIYNIYLKRKSV
jgi:drug/metabolite transporter (DMT)-like permease